MTSRLSPPNAERLQQLITEHALDAVAPAILAVACECWVLRLGAPDDFSAVGNSRIGGVPDLPPDVDWPRHGDKYFNFIMQLRLSDLPPICDHALPPAGTLYLFVGKDDGCINVPVRTLVDLGPADRLLPAGSPEAHELLNEYYLDLVPYRVSAQAAIDLPGYGSKAFQAITHAASAAGVENAEEQFFNLTMAAAGTATDPNVIGKLLGHLSHAEGDPREAACLVQAGRRLLIENTHQTLEEANRAVEDAYEEGDATRIAYYEAQRAAVTWYAQHRKEIEAETKCWRALWRVNSSTAVNLQIWNAGSLHVLVHRDELARPDLSRVYAAIESS